MCRPTYSLIPVFSAGSPCRELLCCPMCLFGTNDILFTRSPADIRRLSTAAGRNFSCPSVFSEVSPRPAPPDPLGRALIQLAGKRALAGSRMSRGLHSRVFTSVHRGPADDLRRPSFDLFAKVQTQVGRCTDGIRATCSRIWRTPCGRRVTCWQRERRRSCGSCRSGLPKAKEQN